MENKIDIITEEDMNKLKSVMAKIMLSNNVLETNPEKINTISLDSIIDVENVADTYAISIHKNGTCEVKQCKLKMKDDFIYTTTKTCNTKARIAKIIKDTFDEHGCIDEWIEAEMLNNIMNELGIDYKNLDEIIKANKSKGDK